MRNLLCILTLAGAVAAEAAPEDRGQRGWYVGGGGGAAIGQATDADGRSAGGFFGGGGYLRVGDEALPGLTLGLAFGGGGGDGNNGKYTTGLGGFFLEASWRAMPETLPGFLAVFGTGVGGGAVDPVGEEGFEGSPGGAIYQVGVNYEFNFGDGVSGFVLAPAARWYFVPSQMDNEAMLSSFVIGVETLWYAGR